MTVQWSEKRPSRIETSWIYAKRFWYWRQNSAPYISGDLFADNADISVYPPKFRGEQPSIRQIRDATVIFCPSDKLNFFLENYFKYISAKVIICGNSDVEFHELPSRVPSTVRQLFLQNSFISASRLVTTLPIGVENLRWGVNGIPKYFSIPGNDHKRQDKIVIGPFGLTHPIRKEIINLYPEGFNEFIVLRDRLSPKNYSRIVQSVKYVAAVRGNGVDTHRVWETLYRGAFPIIQRDNWSLSLESLHLPLLYTDSWDSKTLRSVCKNSKDLKFEPNRTKSLWWPYWKKLINSYT